MSKYCPILKTNVVYLDCIDCDDRKNCDDLKNVEEYVKTNIGEIPISDYQDIIAQQNGFDDYEDMTKSGFHF